MTAPTPAVIELALQGLRVADALGSGAEFDNNEVRALTLHLAAVTAERDQAVENARASKQMHEQARTLLDQTLTERDEIQAETHKVAEMYRIVVKQLADAPHGDDCPTMSGDAYDCNCWKAGL